MQMLPFLIDRQALNSCPSGNPGFLMIAPPWRRVKNQGSWIQVQSFENLATNYL